MKIRVIAFATASEILGSREIDVELAEGSLLADLEHELLARFPALQPVWSRLAVAVDGELAQTSDRPLAANAEVALLPPVSGG